jgi:hypothetical protein
VVEVSEKVRETRLLIPRKLFSAWQADRPQASAAAPPLWVAGVALGLSAAFGGLWLVRRGRTLAAGMAVALVAVGATLSLSGPVRAKARAQLPPVPNFTIADQVVVEVVEQGDSVRLILPKNRP